MQTDEAPRASPQRTINRIVVLVLHLRLDFKFDRLPKGRSISTATMGSQIWTRVDVGPFVQHVLGGDSAINLPLCVSNPSGACVSPNPFPLAVFLHRRGSPCCDCTDRQHVPARQASVAVPRSAVRCTLCAVRKLFCPCAGVPMADTRCAMPTADTWCAMTTPTQQRLYHQVEVIVKSTTETTSRWGATIHCSGVHPHHL